MLFDRNFSTFLICKTFHKSTMPRKKTQKSHRFAPYGTRNNLRDTDHVCLNTPSDLHHFMRMQYVANRKQRNPPETVTWNHSYICDQLLKIQTKKLNLTMFSVDSQTDLLRRSLRKRIADVMESAPRFNLTVTSVEILARGRLWTHADVSRVFALTLPCFIALQKLKLHNLIVSPHAGMSMFDQIDQLKNLQDLSINVWLTKHTDTKKKREQFEVDVQLPGLTRMDISVLITDESQTDRLLVAFDTKSLRSLTVAGESTLKTIKSVKTSDDMSTLYLNRDTYSRLSGMTFHDNELLAKWFGCGNSFRKIVVDIQQWPMSIVSEHMQLIKCARRNFPLTVVVTSLYGEIKLRFN